MKQEDKELLLKDLCARLPYGINLSINGEKAILYGIDENTVIALLDGWNYKKEFIVSVGNDVDEIKPYLRPMSSMSEEEYKEYKGWLDAVHNDPAIQSDGYFDFLNQHHFDYRGLIKKGLALKTPKNMYKTE